MKTYFLALSQGFMLRYFLQTDIISSLLEQNTRLVVLVPDPEDGVFDDYRGKQNLLFEKYEVEACGRYIKESLVERWLKQIRYFVQNTRYDISTTEWNYRAYLEDNREEYSSGKGRLIRIALNLIVQSARRSRLLRRFILWVEHVFFTPCIHDVLFQKYEPQKLIVPSLGTFDFDQLLMREAHKKGVKVVSVVLSWDNTTTRGMPGAHVDHVVAWTEVMREELIQLNDIPPEKISVGGVAHFDHYYHEKNFYSREELFQILGLNPDKKLLFFVTKSPTGYASNVDIAELIMKAVDEGTFSQPVQLLVRLHPIYFKMNGQGYKFQYFLDQISDLEKQFEDLIVNRPHTPSKSMNFFMPESEIKLLASILKHCDVVINMYSTLNIEASIFDKPIVNVNFEGDSYEGPAKARYNIKMDEEQSHNQRVVQSGALAMVNSESELIQAVENALKNPANGVTARKSVKDNECGPFPGAAGKKVGAIILRV